MCFVYQILIWIPFVSADCGLHMLCFCGLWSGYALSFRIMISICFVSPDCDLDMLCFCGLWSRYALFLWIVIWICFVSVDCDLDMHPDQNPIDKAYPDQNPKKERICRSKSEVTKRITLQSEETDHIQTMIRGDCVQSSIFWTIKICWIQIQYLQYLKESKNICITSYFTLMLPTYLMNRTDLVGTS
jgi:hypothetical protein